MKEKSCPFLGLRDDPSTHLDFPSKGNICHKASVQGAVLADHQNRYCLAAKHIDCLVYQSKIPLNPPLISDKRFIPYKKYGLFGVAALLITFSIFITSNAKNNRGFPQNAGLFQSPDDIQTQRLLSGPAGDSVGDRYIPISSIAEEEQPNFVPCPIPDGWVLYTVQPTDSIYRLSVLFGIRVSELIRQNCIKQGEPLLPNQIIYVPFEETSWQDLSMTTPKKINLTEQPVVIPLTETSNPSRPTSNNGDIVQTENENNNPVSVDKPEKDKDSHPNNKNQGKGKDKRDKKNR